MPAYGFQVGSVWPVPRTHGCLHLHQTTAREFSRSPGSRPRYTLPKLNLKTQPEARTLLRPHDHNDPDPPSNILISSQAFKVDPTPYLGEQP
jgi:hypothetical protein